MTAEMRVNDMMQKGSLVVVSGFSGVGKGTVMNSLVSRYNEYALSVSATTRPPREGEQNGKDYFFVTEERFNDMIRDKELIEYASYCDHFYGTPRSFVEKMLSEGRDVILEIEIQGAREIRRQFPEAVLIFIMPPSTEELRRRLSLRGTETGQVIAERLRRAAREAEGIEDYDYIYVNDDADVCADEIHQLIAGKRHLVSRNADFIRKIREEIININNI